MEDGRGVVRDGLGTQIELASDVAIRAARCQQTEDLTLPLGQVREDDIVLR